MHPGLPGPSARERSTGTGHPEHGRAIAPSPRAGRIVDAAVCCPSRWSDEGLSRIIIVVVPWHLELYISLGLHGFVHTFLFAHCQALVSRSLPNCRTCSRDSSDRVLRGLIALLRSRRVRP